MKCPRCGAVVEDGKTVCFMCGAPVDGGTSSGFGSNDNDGFSTGFNNNDSRMNGGGIDDYNPVLNENYYRQREAYNNNRKTNYREAQEKVKKNNDSYKKDIFDLMSEYKLVIRIVLIGLVVLLVGFLIVKWYKKKTAEVPKIPIINDKLYFEVPGAFKKIGAENSSNSTSSATYVLSGDKGSSCTIAVSAGASASEDFVSSYYKTIRTNSMADVYDNDYMVKDYVKIPAFQEGQLAVRGTAWFYLYEYYRKTYPGDFLLLKNRYLNTVKDGYVYSITLVNANDDPKCNLYLDNFVRSLEFID